MKLSHFKDIKRNIIGIPSHVYTGYRLHYSQWETFKSICQIHNETINIWTHLWLFCYVIVLFYRLNDYSKIHFYNIFEDKYHFILFTTYTSALIGSFCSTWTHTFYMTDFKYIKYPWLVDFGGITFAIYFSGVGSTIYVFDGNVKYFYLFFTTYQYYRNVTRGITRHISITKKTDESRTNLTEFMETFCMSALYGWVIPWYYGYLTGNSVESEIFYQLFDTILYLLLGGLFLYSNFPQQKFPGYFDIIGHSHQIWHIFVNIAIINFCHSASMLLKNKELNI